jgi:uncharacterized protein (DUF1330 family)
MEEGQSLIRDGDQFHPGRVAARDFSWLEDRLFRWPDRLHKKKGRAMKKAYWVARAKILDPVKYKRYTDQVPGIIAKFGGKVLARGGRFHVLEGTDKYHRFVVIEFPSFQHAVDCHKSAEYQSAAANRWDGGGDNELIIVEEGDATVV